MFLWYTRAVVSNREKNAWLAITDGQIDLDIAAWRTKPDGVANDVFAGAPQRMRIGVFKDHGIRRFQTYGFANCLCFEVDDSVWTPNGRQKPRWSNLDFLQTPPRL